MNSTYVLRVYGNGNFGVGREVVPGVYLFRSNFPNKPDYELTKQEAQDRLRLLAGRERKNDSEQ